MQIFLKLLFLFFSIQLTHIFGMEKDIDLSNLDHPFFQLPEEIQREIIKKRINAFLKVPRSFNKIKRKILTLRLSNAKINDLLNRTFSAGYILSLANEINSSSVYPISSYQLAKILLNKEKFAEFKKSHLGKANLSGSELLDIINEKIGIWLQPQAYNNYLESIKLLIKAGANLDFTNEQGLFPLDAVISKATNIGPKAIDILKDLINGGASLDLINPQSFSPLQVAVTNWDMDMVKVFIEAEANLDFQNPYNKSTALIEAIKKASVLDQAKPCTLEEKNKMIKVLINAKANLNLQDDEGNTALYWAILNGNFEILKALAEAGANGDLKNNKGDSASMLLKKIIASLPV